MLADAGNEDKFYAVLDHLSDRQWEKFQDAPRYEKQDKTTRYHILCAAHGPEDARKYLGQNLNIDEFRMILIREDLAAGDYVHAEQLCLERVEDARKEQWHRPDQWEHLPYDIYHGWGQREKLIGQARFLTLLGDRDFYQITKDLLIEDGRWEAEYPGFLAELKGKWSPYAYMDIPGRGERTGSADGTGACLSGCGIPTWCCSGSTVRRGDLWPMRRRDSTGCQADRQQEGLSKALRTAPLAGQIWRDRRGEGADPGTAAGVSPAKGAVGGAGAGRERSRNLKRYDGIGKRPGTRCIRALL